MIRPKADAGANVALATGRGVATVPMDTHIGVLEGVALDVKAVAREGAAGNWKVDAKCVGYPPEAFETDNLTPGREEEEAAALCRGCPVIPQCAADALTAFDMTDIWRGREPNGPIVVMGVVRAGIPT